MRKILACVVFILLAFVLAANTARAAEVVTFPEASEGQINEALAKTTNVRILPSNSFYFVIITKETLARFFQPSASRRAEFDFVLTSKRLKETYLLFGKDNTVEASRSLNRYSGRMDKMLEQIAKARAQNQSMEPVVDEMANGFNYQEILFYAISKKFTDSGISDDSFNAASISFIGVIDAIDAFRPGFKNRYRSAVNYTILKAKSLPPATQPKESGHFETTPSANPKRIIY